MKILIYIPQLIYGGAEKVLVSFANDLALRGHEVEVLELYEKGLLKPQFSSSVVFDAVCSKEYTKKYYASLTDIRLERSPLKKLAGCGRLAFSKIVGYRKFAKRLAAKRYAQREYDVAINYLETESPAFLKKHIKAKKYLQWYHTDVAHLDSPGETDKMISDFAEMDAIICVAKSSQKSFVERYPFLLEKTHVLYNFFEKDAVVRMGNEPFSYREECFTMLSVGRITPEKKYLRFLDVLARLKREGYSFSWHILGTGYEQDALLEKIKSLGLERCVFLEGVTDNPYKYMKNCDLFVLPSGREGFPTVTVEAKILGCPVLATDVSGIREQLLHGETGWIVENSEEGLYEGLKHLLDHPDLCQTLKSNRGMERILNNDLKFSEFEEICFGKHSKHKP